MMGGRSTVDVSRSDIQKAAQFAVKRISSGHNLLKVVDAKTQVVAGVMYHLTIETEAQGENYKFDVQVYQPPGGSFELNRFQQH